MFTRRGFLKGSSLAMFGVGVAPSWLARAAHASTGSKKVLVTIFQRGAAVDLNGFFGLHPSLAPLKPIYDANALAIVHATGSPDPTRSHFDAQDYMEAGTPGLKATRDGWLNRALAAQTPQTSPLRALALGPSLP